MKSFVSIIKGLSALGILALAAAGGYLAWQRLTVNETVETLLRENASLRESIGNLTNETQIGYAKVLEQTTREGAVRTRLLFVQTDPEDMTRRIFEKEFEIDGDIVHFDALIVTFSAPLVMEGREKAMYLWRRIYGESMRPEEGLPIYTPYAQPERYAAFGQKLSLPQQKLFWDAIWDLSNDPAGLSHLGVRAIYGNVVYKRLRPGLIYVFKLSPTGGIAQDIVPEL